MDRMWIESMIGFGIQCNTEGLQIDKQVYTHRFNHKRIIQKIL